MRRIAYRFRATINPASNATGASVGKGASVPSVGTGALARPRRDSRPRLSSRAQLGSCLLRRQSSIRHTLLCAAMTMSLVAATTATAATRPDYRGTLRVMLQSEPSALELPANASPAAYWDL